MITAVLWSTRVLSHIFMVFDVLQGWDNWRSGGGRWARNERCSREEDEATCESRHARVLAGRCPRNTKHQICKIKTGKAHCNVPGAPNILLIIYIRYFLFPYKLFSEICMALQKTKLLPREEKNGPRMYMRKWVGDFLKNDRRRVTHKQDKESEDCDEVHHSIFCFRSAKSCLLSILLTGLFDWAPS